MRNPAQGAPQDLGQLVADRLGPGGIALGALLDHPLDHRPREGDPSRLDRLQIAGRKQPPMPSRAIAQVQEGVQRAEVRMVRRQGLDQILALQEARHSGRKARQVEHVVPTAQHGTRTSGRVGPDAAHQKGVGVVRQDVGGREVKGHCRYFHPVSRSPRP